jgi:urease accessory protein
LALGGSAQAHTGLPFDDSFLHGLLHPLNGPDHVLALLAVGLLAAGYGGYALWALPLTFVGLLAVGAGFHFSGLAPLLIELGAVAALVVLGILLYSSALLSSVTGAVAVGVLALLHGHAHSAELPSLTTGLSYGVGFVTASVLLQLIGISFGFIAQWLAPLLLRLAGLAITAAGVYFASALLA